MTQTRTDSVMEALVNVAIGTAIYTAVNHTLLAWVLGVPISVGKSLWISLLFTAISLVRSYAIRRAFNGRSVWQAIKEAFAPRARKRGPKFLILGYARHGKDTAAEYLRDRHGVSFQSSSYFLAEKVVRPALAARGINYPSLDACYADRVNHRALWRDIIADYNGENPSRLAEAILAESDCYVGMRTAREYEASRHLFDCVFWVDASERGVPPEPRDSMDIDYNPSRMIYISNNGSPEEMYRELDCWVRAFSWVRPRR